MDGYNHNEIENKWRKIWSDHNLYKAIDFSEKPKKYILAEFPYPSGKALHVGHTMRYTVPDVYSRFLRMRGYNVMFPMGFDAFGLPSEIYAIKTGTNPIDYTNKLISDYKDSLSKMGYGIDLEREFSTTDPEYYKWTQWIFLKLHKAGLAEYKEMPIWWCETLRTVLADEEVLTDKNGNKISERGEYPVERKMFKQWVLKMPKFAESLIAGLTNVDFPDSIKNAQINWIGKSEGINITYPIEGSDEHVTVFTTRPDTNFGATFIVLAPENNLIPKITQKEHITDVQKYVEIGKNRSELERISELKDKTGVFTGSYAINPLNNTKIPIYVADYALKDVGTGAVVGVPGHDKRDFEFAQKFHLPIIRVVVGKDEDASPITDISQVQEAEGKIINSDFLNGLNVEEAIQKAISYIEEQGFGKKATTYKLRDWVFSRQRYWGEPIPVIHKENGDIEMICDPDNPDDVKNLLPLLLPDVPDYNPTVDGSSPLEKNKAWVKTTAKDGTPATRETNTMPNWAGSCWYYLRFCDPKNHNTFADIEKLKYWLPVDRYFGGAEHTTLHLLYSRFWHQFLYQQKLVPTPEPYAWRLNGGLLLGPDGKKMSKSRGNIVEPLDYIEKYGADSLRMLICFLGPYEDTYPWNDSGSKATYKLIRTIYHLKNSVSDEPEELSITKAFHKMLKNITYMFDNLKMNTAVSEIMIFINSVKNAENINKETWKSFLKVIAPLAPFVSEELWQELNGDSKWEEANSIHLQSWPILNEELAGEKIINIPVQINGKVRTEIEVGIYEQEIMVKDKVLADPKVQKYLTNGFIKKIIYIKGKIVNIVI